MEYNIIYSNTYNKIKNKNYKQFFKYCCDKAPEPEKLLDVEKTVRLAETLFTLRMFRFSKDKQDLVLISFAFNNLFEHTDKSSFEHPLQAAKFLTECNKEIRLLDNNEIDFLYKLVSAHSGQWNTSKGSKVRLPEPKNKYQKFVNMCEYLVEKGLKFDE